MKRLADIAAGHVQAAIEGLDLLAVDREKIEWEVFPFVGMDGSAHWLVGVGLPVPLTDDSIMPFSMIDPHDPPGIARVVRGLYEKVIEEVAEEARKVTSAANGHGKAGGGTTPGGLIVP
jgi:hypothetical protein